MPAEIASPGWFESGFTWQELCTNDAPWLSWGVVAFSEHLWYPDTGLALGAAEHFYLCSHETVCASTGILPCGMCGLLIMSLCWDESM